MKHIEPGCLAVIINSGAPGNIGKTVRVIENIDSGITYRLNVKGRNIVYDPAPFSRWLCEVLEGEVQIAVSSNDVPVYSSKGLCREQWLMPIGDEDYAKQVKEVLENVH